MPELVALRGFDTRIIYLLHCNLFYRKINGSQINIPAEENSTSS